MSVLDSLKIKILLLPVLLLPALSSCGDKGVDGEVPMPLTDIVTYNGKVDGVTTFTFQKIDDTPLLTLTAPGFNLDEDSYPTGTRMLLRYVPAGGTGAYSSGEITPLGGYVITQSNVVTEWREEYSGWNHDPVYVYSLWRTGEYINMRVRLTYSSEPRLFCVALDPETADSDWPELYLVHTFGKDIDGHEREYYASFSIASVWERSDVKGVIMHVADTNLDKHIFTFAKSN